MVAAASVVPTLSSLATQLDSASFAHQYNGDVYPVPSYTEGGSLLWSVAPSSDGDFLTYQSLITESGYWRSADTEWTTAGALNGSGWTIELRVHILNDVAEGTERSLMLFGQDGGGSTQGRMGRVWIGQNTLSVARSGANTQLLLDSSDNTDGFHVFRLAQQPASSVTYLWRDGVYLAGYTPTFTTSSTVAAMYVGDAGGAIGGPTVQIDYVRWDAGFWEPVPEPSSLTLVALGLGLGGVARRHRRVKQNRCVS